MNLLDQLREKIRKLGQSAVAFSGGVDSSLVAKISFDVLGEDALAVTIVSPMLPGSELEKAKQVANLIGIKHILVQEDHLNEEVIQNNPDRCYFCKKIEFGRVIQAAKQRGIHIILDGSNADDKEDYRPGAKALAELSVISPLKDFGITKKQVRELAKLLGLPNWEKPAYACLASRIPYGEVINPEKLKRIEQAEDYIRSLGFYQFRVRSHQEIARIEIESSEMRKVLDQELMKRIAEKLKEFGFIYVSLDLEGYRTGSLNQMILKKDKE